MLLDHRDCKVSCYLAWKLLLVVQCYSFLLGKRYNLFLRTLDIKHERMLLSIQFRLCLSLREKIRYFAHLATFPVNVTRMASLIALGSFVTLLRYSFAYTSTFISLYHFWILMFCSWSVPQSRFKALVLVIPYLSYWDILRPGRSWSSRGFSWNFFWKICACCSWFRRSVHEHLVSYGCFGDIFWFWSYIRSWWLYI